MKKNIYIWLLIGVSVLFIGCGTYLYFNNESITENKNNETAGEVKKENSDDETVNQYKEFLINSYISFDGAVGANDPEGFYFTEDGRFAYHHGGYCIRNVNQDIAYYGTYEISNNELVLNVKARDYAVGGSIVSDVISGDCLDGYQHSVVEANDVIKYSILDYVNDGVDMYLLLNDDLRLYRVGASTEKLESIIDNGFDSN